MSNATSNIQPINIALDIGYGQLKFCSDERVEEKIPSVVYKIDENNAALLDRADYTDDTGSYIIGRL